MDINSFIDIQGFKSDYPDFEHEVECFIAEMDSGLAGKKSSLKMIPSYVADGDAQAYDEYALAIDMGGTNLRVALVYFDENGVPEIKQIENYPMPGHDKPLHKDKFFDIVAGYIEPFLTQTKKIGLCFSFPCEILPNLDGRILYFNKEVQINGAENESLKENLSAALNRRGAVSDISLVVINDTVAALLGGKAQTVERSYGSHIGFILGTGTNICYAEENRNISKNDLLSQLPHKTIVNIESGGYAGFKRSALDLQHDASTLLPGEQQFEKLVSGGYQGELFLAYLHEAAERGCFSKAACDNLRGVKVLSGYEIDQFILNPFGNNRLSDVLSQNDDKLSCHKLINALHDRSAFLTAISLAAVIKKTQIADPLRPVCISAEGSTFRKCKTLNQKTSYYLYAYAHKIMRLHYDFLYADNTTILGSAYAALIK